jgi:hypothetical protein
MKRKAPGCIAGLVILLAAHLSSPTAAQDSIDGVTGFPRNPVHVAAWPGGKKVAVSFALFVEAFGFGQGPVFRPDGRRDWRQARRMVEPKRLFQWRHDAGHGRRRRHLHPRPNGF